MGVYIPDMEMPADCDECWTKYHGFGMVEHDPEWGTFYCKLAKGFCVDPRTKCPLVPVPPHGRLGDLDALQERAHKHLYASNHGSIAEAHFAALIDLIDNAPAIIPAEEEALRCEPRRATLPAREACEQTETGRIRTRQEAMQGCVYFPEAIDCRTRDLSACARCGWNPVKQKRQGGKLHNAGTELAPGGDITSEIRIDAKTGEVMEE